MNEVMDSMYLKSEWVKRFIARKIATAVNKKFDTTIELGFLDDINVSNDGTEVDLLATVHICIPKRELKQLLSKL